MLRLQAARSAGSALAGHRCNDSETLAVDSKVQLHPGAKAWLEPISVTSSGRTRFQIICQNESPRPVKIKVTHASLPWIEPDGPLRCKDWTKGRLDCTESGSQRLALICAIAQKKTWVATHEIQRNASVTMRGGAGSAGAAKLAGSEAERLESVIAREINPKIAACENLFDREATLIWTVGPDGRVTEAAWLKPAGEDRFADCALEIIRTTIFPPSFGALKIHSSFQ